jgi:raffinose/stachyose/melibiose transport system permease protein
LRQVRDKWQLYAFMLPTYLLVIVFAYQPAFSALYHSFFYWNGIRENWVGFDNFLEFGRDPYFYNAVWNMLQLTVFRLATHLSFPLLVAVLLFRLRNHVAAYWYRTALVVPLVVPSVVTFLVWRWFYSYEGLVNIVLRGIGHPEAVRAWFGDPSLALYALMFVGLPWAGGLAMLIYLAGLQQIPTEVIEAAVVDGVGTWSRFFRIELPLILGQVKLLLILNLIDNLQQFTLPLVMTSGGPGWATMVPALRMYQVTTGEYRYGYASAIGVALFAVILAFTYLNQRYLRSSVEYEAR